MAERIDLGKALGRDELELGKGYVETILTPKISVHYGMTVR